MSPIRVRWGPVMQSADADDHTERSTLYQTGVWHIPPRETALVLVDIWGTHSIRSHADRATHIVEERIRPVVEAARRSGMTVVHAPSAGLAVRHAPWHRRVLFGSHGLDESDGSGSGLLGRLRRICSRWPPLAFRQRREPYRAYLRTRPPVRLGPTPIEFHPAVRPIDGEPVVASGRELHQLLKARRILHLFYAGFATNVCVISGRDYSMRAMRRRGYNLILLRDCTTGIENAETVDELLLTRAAMLEAERWGASTTADDFLETYRRTSQVPTDEEHRPMDARVESTSHSARVGA